MMLGFNNGGPLSTIQTASSTSTLSLQNNSLNHGGGSSSSSSQEGRTRRLTTAKQIAVETAYTPTSAQSTHSTLPVSMMRQWQTQQHQGHYRPATILEESPPKVEKHPPPAPTLLGSTYQTPPKRRTQSHFIGGNTGAGASSTTGSGAP